MLAADLDQQQQAQILKEANDPYLQARNVSATDLAEAKQAFSAAAQKYQTLVDSGVANGKLYFNLANAYLQSGSLGRAIANYERAERLLPGDRAVLGNLQYVRSLLPEANTAEAETSMSQTLASWNTAVPLNTRWTLALVAWNAVWLAAIGHWYFQSFRWHYVAIPGVAVFLTCVISLGYQWSQLPTGETGVVVAQTATVHESNGEAFAVKYAQPLPEGTSFDVLQRRGDWIDIYTFDGQTGWVRSQNVELVSSL
jgi:tetratricopeptide (TPR) repeat protein